MFEKFTVHLSLQAEADFDEIINSGVFTVIPRKSTKNEKFFGLLLIGRRC